MSCHGQGLARGCLCLVMVRVWPEAACVLSWSGFGQRLPVSCHGQGLARGCLCLVMVRVWPAATCVSCCGQGLAGGYLLAFCGGTGSDV